MNCIRFDAATGAILSVGHDPDIRVSEIVGDLPEDFMSTFALGKYIAAPDATGAAVVSAVAGWIAPPTSAMPVPI